MDPAEVLRMLGGVATRPQLLAHMTRWELERAVEATAVLHRARDTYALPTLDDSIAQAHALRGVLCLTSAALFHGWAVKELPDRPHISVPRGRRRRLGRDRAIALHWHDLAPDDIVDGVVTSREATLLHCLRSLPFDEALAIADSAARSGEQALLRRVAAQVRGHGAAQVWLVVLRFSQVHSTLISVVALAQGHTQVG